MFQKAGLVRHTSAPHATTDRCKLSYWPSWNRRLTAAFPSPPRRPTNAAATHRRLRQHPPSRRPCGLENGGASCGRPESKISRWRRQADIQHRYHSARSGQEESTPTTTLHVTEPAAQYLLRPPLVVDCSRHAGFFLARSAKSRPGNRLKAAHCVHNIFCTLKSPMSPSENCGMASCMQAKGWQKQR